VIIYLDSTRATRGGGNLFVDVNGYWYTNREHKKQYKVHSSRKRESMLDLKTDPRFNEGNTAYLTQYSVRIQLER